jgi:hypothetical protein
MPPSDRQRFDEFSAAAEAARVHCRASEFAIHWPFIEPDEFSSGIGDVLRRAAARGRPGGKDERCRLGSFSPGLRRTPIVQLEWPLGWESFCETILDTSLEDRRSSRQAITHRETVVRVLEFLYIRDAPDDFQLPRRNSRPFAVASIVAGVDLPARGEKPWTVEDVIEAEGKAIWHHVKRLAQSRAAL